MSDEDEYEDEDEGSDLLGTERWVQFSFIAIAVATFYVVNKVSYSIAEYWIEPNSTIVSAVAAVVGILTGFLLYRNPTINDFANETASELSKVTWPDRKETYSSTIVVIVTSIIAAVYLGLIDFLWSKLTDIIYTV